MYRHFLPDESAYKHLNLWLGVVCVLIFIFFSSVVIYINQDKVDARLEADTAQAYNRLVMQLSSSSDMLNGFAAYFSTVDQINLNNLKKYSDSIREQHPHIYMTQYMVRVPGDALVNFVKQHKTENNPSFQVTEFSERDRSTLIPVSERDIHYPIVFMNPPMVRVLPLIGYDVYSSNIFHQTINKAIEQNANYSTRPFQLYEGGLGYMIIRPIHTTNIFHSYVKQSYWPVGGLVSTVIRFEDLINNIGINKTYTLQLIHHDALSHTDTIVGTKNTAVESGTLLPGYAKRLQFTSAGQTFTIALQRQLYWSDISYEWIVFSFIATAAISLLLFNFFHMRMQSAREHRQTQAELFREKELAEVTLHSIGEAVITTSVDERIQYMNPIACLLTGWSSQESINQPLSKVFRLISEESREEINSTVKESLKLQCTVRSDEPTLLINKKGDEFAIENSAALIREGNGVAIGVVLVFRNISHIRNMSKKMEFQATHDALTELINRREFEHQLKLAVMSARDENHHHALCYMDLDQFKIVNDTCGHIAGDQLLRELSKIMPNCIRASDCLARLGGDEFGVLMFDCPLSQASKVADTLREAIKDFTFSWDKKTFDIGVSIGLVPINKDSGSLQDIMRRADSSCYIAKDLGRNRVHIYTPDDIELSKRHGEMQWLTRIQKAISNDSFSLSLQLVRSINDNNAKIHYEVLLRMKNEDGTLIPPMSFIPAAERYDMMPELDMWVIKTAFNKIHEEIFANNIGCIYNINLSGQSLSNSEIAGFIREQVQYYEIPPDCLCFEITETAIIANLGLAIEFIKEMKDIGCKFALDDFGSGLSSFAYLKKLPVDYLKIDGAFVRDILSDPMDRAIVAAINDIGHEMGLMTVAEYVENEHILTLLKKLGVDYAQGYAIGKPEEWITTPVAKGKSHISLVPAPRA